MSILAAPLAREADFQAAWYYSLLIFVVLLVIAGSFELTRRWIAPMWRAGERGLAAVVLAAAAVPTLMFVLLLVTVVVAMLPSATGGR